MRASLRIPSAAARALLNREHDRMSLTDDNVPGEDRLQCEHNVDEQETVRNRQAGRIATYCELVRPAGDGVDNDGGEETLSTRRRVSSQ